MTNFNARRFVTVWHSVGFITLSGRNYSEDAYFANGLNREYCPYGQAWRNYTTYCAALLPEIPVHRSISSLRISV